MTGGWLLVIVADLVIVPLVPARLGGARARAGHHDRA